MRPRRGTTGTNDIVVSEMVSPVTDTYNVHNEEEDDYCIEERKSSLFEEIPHHAPRNRGGDDSAKDRLIAQMQEQLNQQARKISMLELQFAEMLSSMNERNN